MKLDHYYLVKDNASIIYLNSLIITIDMSYPFDYCLFIKAFHLYMIYQESLLKIQSELKVLKIMILMALYKYLSTCFDLMINHFSQIIQENS